MATFFLVGALLLIAPVSAQAEVQYLGCTSASDGTTGASGSSSLTLPVPSSVQAGDLLITTITTRQTTGDLIIPSGWTLLHGNVVGGSDGVRLNVIWKRADVNEPLNHTFNLTSPHSISGSICGYRGVVAAPANPFDDSAITYPGVYFGGSNSQITTPSLTPSGPHRQLVSIVAVADNDANVMPAAGTSHIVNQPSSSNPNGNRHIVNQQYWASGLPTGPRQFNSTLGNNRLIAVNMLLVPATGLPMELEMTTWNIIGLDKNQPLTHGPNVFPVGVELCNQGGQTFSSMNVTMNWDQANAYISTSAGTPTTLNLPNISPGQCRYAYFSVTIDRDAAAYHQSRDFHIRATWNTSSGTGYTTSTTLGREIYVQEFQRTSRNTIFSMTSSQSSFVVGDIATFTISGRTATGYPQLFNFIHFDPTMFRTLETHVTYSFPEPISSNYIWADACGLDMDPASPDYQKCVGPELYPGGRVGRDFVLTYTVQVIGSGDNIISSAIYNKSGNAFHYQHGPALEIQVDPPAADLEITKSHTGPFVQGQTGIYELEIRNNGPDNALVPLNIVDTLPDGLTFMANLTEEDWGCSTEGQEVACTWSKGTDYFYVNETSILRLEVMADVGAPSNVVNTATVTADVDDPDLSNNTATDPTEIVALVDLDITKSHASDFIVGENNSWQLDVVNHGPHTEFGPIVVTDTIPDNITYLGYNGIGWSCIASGQDVTCEYSGSLGPDDNTPTLNLEVRAENNAQPGVTNTAEVTGTSQEQDPANNISSNPTPVLPSSDLVLSKTAAGTFTAGMSATYEFEVTNDGPSTHPGPFIITDTLPNSTTYTGYTGINWMCSTISQDVTCEYTGVLAVGSSTTVQVHVDIASDAPASIDNTATVSSSVFDADLDNNTATTNTPVDRPADLGIDKTHFGNFTVGIDNAYTITVTNYGPARTQGSTTVTDNLPDGLTYIGIDNPDWSCSAIGQTVICSTNQGLDPGEWSAFTMDVAVGDDAYPGVTNTATVNGGGNDPNLSNNTTSDPTIVLGSSDLSISKSHTGDFFSGNVHEYEIVVTNNGPQPSPSGIIVTDTLPTGLSYDSHIAPGFNCIFTDPEFVCESTEPLAVGSSRVIELRVLADGSAVGTVVNVVDVTGPNYDPDTDNNIAEDPTNIVAQGDLEINKTSSGTFYVDQAAEWEIFVTNHGPDPSSPTVTDTLPAGFTYIGFSGLGWSCALVADTVECEHAATLAVGESSLLTLDVIPTNAALGTIINTADVSGTANDPDMSNNTSDDSVEVLESSDLSLTKTALDSFVVGADARWRLIVANDGPSDHPGPIQIVDELPAGVDYVDATGPGWTCVQSGSDVICDYAGGLLVGETLTLDLRVDVGPAAEPGVTNIATVGSSVYDPDPDNNSDSSTVPVGLLADLEITKSHTGNFREREEGTYLIQVVNLGPSTAGGPIVVEDTLPPELEFNRFESVDFACSHSAGVVECIHAGDLDAGETLSVSIIVDAIAEGNVINTATVNSSTDDPDLSNNTVEDPTIILEPIPVADLSLTKWHDGSDWVVGENSEWHILIQNAGLDEADGPIEVVDTLPAGITYIGTSTSTSDWSCIADGQEITCTHPDPLPSGDSRMLTLVTQADAAGTFVNTAEVSSPTDDPNPGNNSDSASGDARDPVTDLSLMKSYSGDPEVGNTITYYLSVTNLGLDDSPAPVEVIDTPASQLSYVTYRGTDWSCAPDGDDIVCQYNQLIPSGATRVVELDFEIVAGGEIVNHAVVSGPHPDPNLGNNEDSITLTAEHADLQLIKEGDSPFVAGTVGSYSFTVTNLGPDTAEGPITLTDIVPTGLNIIQVSGTDWSCSFIGQAITCVHNNDLPVGAVRTVVLDVAVSPDFEGDVSNTANVNGPTHDPNPNNNNDSHFAPVSNEINLHIDITSQNDVLIGEILTYRIDVGNDGPSQAHQRVEMINELPVGMIYLSAQGSGFTCLGGDEYDDTSITDIVYCSKEDGLEPGVTIPIYVEVMVEREAYPQAHNYARVLEHPTETTYLDNETTYVLDVPEPIYEADLSISKTLIGNIVAGDEAIYRFRVENHGPDPSAAPVHIYDMLPVGLTYAGTSSPGWTCFAAGALTHCQHINPLPAGETIELDMIVRADGLARGAFTNCAEVDSPTLDPILSNNQDCTSNPIGVDLDISLSKHADGPFQLGKFGRYIIQVTNDGPSSTAGPITVQEQLPKELEYHNHGGDTGWNCKAGRPVMCTHPGPLHAGESLELQLITRVQRAGKITNHASVSIPESERSLANNQASVTINVDEETSVPAPGPNDGDSGSNHKPNGGPIWWGPLPHTGVGGVFMLIAGGIIALTIGSLFYRVSNVRLRQQAKKISRSAEASADNDFDADTADDFAVVEVDDEYSQSYALATYDPLQLMPARIAVNNRILRYAVEGIGGPEIAQIAVTLIIPAVSVGDATPAPTNTITAVADADEREEILAIIEHERASMAAYERGTGDDDNLYQSGISRVLANIRSFRFNSLLNFTKSPVRAYQGWKERRRLRAEELTEAINDQLIWVQDELQQALKTETELKEEREAVKMELSSLHTQAADTEIMFNKTRKQQDQLLKQLAEEEIQLEATVARRDEIAQEVAEAREKVEQQREKLQELADGHEELEEQFASAKTTLAEAKQLLDHLNQEVAAKQGQLSSTRQESTDLRIAIQKNQNLIAKLREDIKITGEEVESTQSQLNSLRELLTGNDTNDASVGIQELNFHRHLAELQELKAQQEQEIQNHESKLEELQIALQTDQQKFHQAHNEYTKQSEQAVKLEASYRSTSIELQDLQDRARAIMDEIEAHTALYTELTQQRQQLDEASAHTQAKIDKITSAQQEHSEQYAQYQEHLRQLVEQRADLHRLIATEEEVIRGLQENQHQLEQTVRSRKENLEETRKQLAAMAQKLQKAQEDRDNLRAQQNQTQQTRAREEAEVFAQADVAKSFEQVLEQERARLKQIQTALEASTQSSTNNHPARPQSNSEAAYTSAQTGAAYIETASEPSAPQQPTSEYLLPDNQEPSITPSATPPPTPTPAPPALPGNSRANADDGSGDSANNDDSIASSEPTRTHSVFELLGVRRRNSDSNASDLTSGQDNDNTKVVGQKNNPVRTDELDYDWFRQLRD